MNSLVYVLRDSKQSIARSVCMKEGSGVVLSLVPGKADGSVKPSYTQVLELLLKADKVITL